MSISTLLKAAGTGIKTHKPEIMIGLGVAAGAGAIATAIKATPIFLETFDNECQEQPDVEIEVDGKMVTVKPDLDIKRKVLIFGKCYWVTLLLEAASITLIIFGTKIRLNGYTALAAVYGVTKAELDDLKQVISEQPETWKKKFAEKMAESHIDHSDINDIPPERMSNAEVPMPCPLFYDDQAKVYFRKSEEELRDAVAEITHEIVTDPFDQISMNDWMRILDHEPVVHGDYLLLTMDNQPDEPLKYKQISVKESPTGEPARVMSFTWNYHTDTRAIYCDN